jgi:hypothetical protein
MKLRSILFTATLVASAAPFASAQTVCHVENDGNNYNDNVFMGAVLLGVEFTAPSSFSVNRIEVFTGEAAGNNSVAIWTHDSVNNQPGTPISTGVWSMSATDSWQGANLPSNAPIVSGTTYWMVWGVVGGSQASIDLPMVTLGQPYRGSFDNGQTWNGPFQFNDRHWKFRLYGDCGGVSFCFGDGTQPTGCPCANTGASGHGCNNSSNTGGAILTSSGTASLSADTLQLTSSGEKPTATSIFLQGNASIANGVPFGQGVRCAGGVLKRLYVKTASGGTAIAPVAGDPTVDAQSAALGDPITAGSTRYYQTYYRDPTVLGGCPSVDTFNVSQGLAVFWSQ